jgi:hypothetical protein
MLETAREFGLEQLAWRSELDVLRSRHARYFLALAEQAEPELWGPAAGMWLRRLEAEHDNVRAALEWGLTLGGETGRTIALRLAGALASFWWTRDHVLHRGYAILRKFHTRRVSSMSREIAVNRSFRRMTSCRCRTTPPRTAGRCNSRGGGFRSCAPCLRARRRAGRSPYPRR